MKLFFALGACAGYAAAHNIVTNFHVNGVSRADCVRQAASLNPITDLSSTDMACNAVQGNGASKCAVKPGDNIAFEWRVDRNIPAASYPLKQGSIRQGVTDPSHKGPCAVYMKKADDALTAVGAGDGWFKVSEDGIDSNGLFCSTRLREANAAQPGVVPEDIPLGDYLIRAEMLTLNNAGPANVGGGEQPQFFVGCIQATVSGTSGTAALQTVSIPGYVNRSTPGLIYDIWSSETYENYPRIGPPPLVQMQPFEGMSNEDSSDAELAVTSTSNKTVSTTSETTYQPTPVGLSTQQLAEAFEPTSATTVPDDSTQPSAAVESTAGSVTTATDTTTSSTVTVTETVKQTRTVTETDALELSDVATAAHEDYSATTGITTVRPSVTQRSVTETSLECPGTKSPLSTVNNHQNKYRRQHWHPHKI